MIFGVNDTHVDVKGRTLIRNRLNELPIALTFMEVHAGRKSDAWSLCVTDHCYRRLHTRRIEQRRKLWMHERTLKHAS